MFAFLSLLFVLLVIFAITTAKHAEGFESPSHTVQLPIVPSPTSLTAPAKEAKATQDAPSVPATLPGALPSAPYQQIAVSSPLPYQDTTMIKANRQQLVSLLEMMKGFLSFEAQELTDRSDPSIQLPLSNARSDFQILQNAVSLLNRNPGLQPNLTLSNLNEMSANLAYLQEQVRLTGAAGTLKGPTPVEGFTNAPAATLADITEFSQRVQAEIVRLSASGTNDPLIQARVAAMTRLKADVQNIINRVNAGSLLETEIPILKADVDRAFRALSKTNEPLPQIVKSLNLPEALENLLPSNLRKDPETTRHISRLIDKYADQIVQGVSASFSVKYTSPMEAQLGPGAESTVNQTGFPSMADLNNVSNAHFKPADSGRPVTDRLAPLPVDAGRGPARFDWKVRSKEIEAQIKQRGLQPTDFGVMPQGTVVSDDFSWKGYARMMCNRLQATMDPALPETCGCPPMDWKGWRIAK